MIDLSVLAENEMITLVSFKRHNYYELQAHTRMTVNPELYRDHFYPLTPWLRAVQDAILQQLIKETSSWITELPDNPRGLQSLINESTATDRAATNPPYWAESKATNE